MQNESLHKKNITISKAIINDIVEIEQLVNSAYRGESSKKGWTTEADLLDGIRTSAEALTEMLNNKAVTVLKCIEQNKIIGCVYLEKKDDKMYLGMLTVSPALQANGIGKLLLNASEELALQQHCKKMKITVITTRKELIAWYERYGYKATGEKEPFPDDPKFGIPKMPLEFMVMEKQIA